MFGGDPMADNEEKTDLRKNIIEASLLLDSGLFDDEPEVETSVPVERGSASGEEDAEGSSDDAMDAGFSVTVDDERAVSDTRKAQLEAIRYFLKSEPVHKNAEARTKEKLKMPEKPKVKVARPQNGMQKRPKEAKSDKPQERSKMALERNEGLIGTRVKDKDSEIKMAIREMKSRPRKEEKGKRQAAGESKVPLPGYAKRRNEVKDKVKPDKLMKMDIKDLRSGMDMKSKMDMEMNVEQEVMTEYFRR
jgi:hypothetical protein